MTPEAFAKMALSLPEAEASSHFDIKDFRVSGKIFATSGKTAGKAALKLTPDQQQMLCAAEPRMFAPVDGAWGLKGWTHIILAEADAATAKSGLRMAWTNVAPKALSKAQRG